MASPSPILKDRLMPRRKTATTAAKNWVESDDSDASDACDSTPYATPKPKRVTKTRIKGPQSKPKDGAGKESAPKRRKLSISLPNAAKSVEEVGDGGTDSDMDAQDDPFGSPLTPLSPSSPIASQAPTREVATASPSPPRPVRRIGLGANRPAFGGTHIGSGIVASLLSIGSKDTAGKSTTLVHDAEPKDVRRHGRFVWVRITPTGEPVFTTMMEEEVPGMWWPAEVSLVCVLQVAYAHRTYSA
jgi:hypothetical protein